MGDTRTVIQEVVNGQVRLRPARPGEAERLRETGRGELVREIPDQAFSQAQQRALVERQTRESGRLGAFGESLLRSVGTPGVATTIQRHVNPEAALESQQLAEAFPAASIFGSVLPDLIGGGLALGRGAITTGAGLLTQGGVATAFGEGIGRAATQRLAGLIGQRGAGIAGNVVAAGGDAALGGLAASIDQSTLRNDPITIESLAADVGISTALGLGLGSALGGIGSAVSRGTAAARRSFGDNLRRIGNNMEDTFPSRAIQGLGSVIGRTTPEVASLGSTRARRLFRGRGNTRKRHLGFDYS